MLNANWLARLVSQILSNNNFPDQGSQPKAKENRRMVFLIILILALVSLTELVFVNHKFVVSDSRD